MEQYQNPQGSSKGLSIAALICGILGIVGYVLSYTTLGSVDTSAETINVTGSVIIGIIGLILGIAVIICLWVPVLGIGIAIAGLVLSLVSKGKGFTGGIRTAAFILSLISIGLSVIGTISCIACIACGGYYY